MLLIELQAFRLTTTVNVDMHVNRALYASFDDTLLSDTGTNDTYYQALSTLMLAVTTTELYHHPSLNWGTLNNQKLKKSFLNGNIV